MRNQDILKLSAILVLLTFILYGNTLSHDFALDDYIVITGNNFTKKGLGGIKDIMTHDAFVGTYGEALELTGGRYRPLSIVSFALEYEFFGRNPFVGHLGNLLLFALSTVLVFLLFVKILDEKNSWLPLIIAVLFLIHPIHTEVVANIKSRDEIMVVLFLIIALLISTYKSRILWLLVAPAVYFLALLSKENAITYIAIIPLFWHMLLHKKAKEIVIGMFPYLLISGLYLMMRSEYAGMVGDRVTTDIMDDPYLYASLSEKFGTIAYTIGKYLLLLVFPHPLSSDYSFNQVPLIQLMDMKAIASIIITISLLVLAVIRFRDKPMISFGILFFFITFSIVSNAVFNVGTSMAERFIYLPSLGICIAIASFIYPYLFRKGEGRDKITTIWVLPLIGILLLSSYKTIARNNVWKNNFELYKTDVGNVPNSARIHLYYGIELITKYNQTKDLEYLNKAIDEIRWSARINPDFHHAHYNLAVAYEKAAKTSIENNRLGEGAHNYNAALDSYLQVLRIQPKHIKSNLNLGLLYGKVKKDFDKSIFYFSKLINTTYNAEHLYDNLGIAYGMKGDLENAKRTFLQGIKFNPQSAKLYFNLAITCDNMGDKEFAKQYYAKAFELNPALKN
ncbi:MAG TPA: DUF1736 domain-containing protein [Flavobacteriales bacterium]|nr:DUF1736 domain-containing protein [Flavobacteriales bacterium]